MENLWILAQTQEVSGTDEVTSTPVTEQETTTSVTAEDANTGGGKGRQPSLFEPSTLIFVGLLIVMMYMMLFRGPRKRQQEHNQMVQSLEKNDKVRTIGGIIGTVVDVREDEIVLKVDESNNTKIRIAPSAIGKNLTKEKK
jgi:preprotein translocase subunit YajC